MSTENKPENLPALNVDNEGMSLRDYFAAKAMLAEISAYDSGITENSIKKVAELAYLMADAMLQERVKNEK